MIRPTIWTLVLSMTFVSALGSAATAAGTPEQKCQAAKMNAIRKRDYCRAGEQQKALLGKTPDLAKCAATFTKAIAGADKTAAKDSASCRWLSPGDGTVTDLNTGLQWQRFGSYPSSYPGMSYTWSTDSGFGATGTAFGSALSTINAGRSIEGITTSAGCLGGKCDWRLPTVEELRGILSAQYPQCPPPGAAPCTTFPDDAAPYFGASNSYWTASTYEGDRSMAWTVSFENGFVRAESKGQYRLVRAVRGQS